VGFFGTSFSFGVVFCFPPEVRLHLLFVNWSFPPLNHLSFSEGGAVERWPLLIGVRRIGSWLGSCLTYVHPLPLPEKNPWSPLPFMRKSGFFFLCSGFSLSPRIPPPLPPFRTFPPFDDPQFFPPVDPPVTSRGTYDDHRGRLVPWPFHKQWSCFFGGSRIANTRSIKGICRVCCCLTGLFCNPRSWLMFLCLTMQSPSL